MAEIKQYIFFDFEMLCSNRGMSYENMEAIRLGAVKYDLKTQKIEYFDRFIKPTNDSPLTTFCKNLTGIHDTDLIDAEDFKTVFTGFLAWIGGVKKSIFFSWSKSDLARLKLDSQRHDLPQTTIDKIDKRYVDFQAIFTKRVSKTDMSVDNALGLYGLSFIGNKHNPMYDAYNTLRIYLSFLNEPIKSDMIMLNQFIFDNENIDCIEAMNSRVNNYLIIDVNLYLEQLNDIYKMKDAIKVVKKTRRLVEKYENIILNRSGLFSKQTINNVGILVTFYQELLQSYEEHFTHSSKIMLLDDYIYKPFNQLTLKRG